MRIAGFASLWIAVQLSMPSGIAAADAAKPVAGAPATMAAAPATAAIVGHANAGSHFFRAICIYCHHLDDTVSAVGAPGLKGALHRYGEAWLDRWLADPRGFSDSDAKARALIAANPYGLVMPAFPAMQDAQNRADVIAFLKALETANGKDEPAAQ